MGFAAVAEAIRDRFTDQVATPNSLTVHHDNAPPTGLKASWYRLRIEPQSTTLVGTGGSARRFRTEGVARVELFAPLTQGDGALLDVADDISAAFRGVQVASPDLHFRAPRLVGQATRTDAWFQRTMEIPFWFDEVG